MMKGNNVRRNHKGVLQSIVKVPKELIKLQQDVELVIDCFFVNNHIFHTTYSIALRALRYASPWSLISNTGIKH
jgi:hypothetical protein